jgi:2-polyprenyl-3-methyl-5-hydroxy-6-metoxy-1,4-benzoquinol methylase
LQQQVAQPAFAIRDVEGLLLLVAMYKSLDDIGCSSALRAIPLTDWPLSLASLAKRSLFDIRKELAYAEKIPSLGSINNAVSQKVRAQYEENPYPRWMHCIRLKDKMDYFDGLWSSFLPVQHKNKPEIAKPEILIAGCGTGLHPLQVALNHPANVTAVDITRRSLGYAAMKQAEYKADNLTFYHMDLLDLQRLDKTFDAIECGGVLHHMADPEAGLEALLSVLKPEGILTLGLYSEIARRNVVNVRNAYLKTGMQPTLENIRAVRSALIHNQADIAYSLVALFGDFYSTSACRDLLFHEQEHRFTTSQLKDLLNKYDLEFLGVVVKPAARNRFIQEYGADKLCDLDAWGEYEEAHPGTFGNMYQFQVRRRNPGTIH